MAMYSTIIGATQEELGMAFTGWRRPLGAPVKREGRNPFTGGPVTYDCWDPDPAAAAAGLELQAPRAEVAAIRGDYHVYLERRLDVRVRPLPHACMKGFTELHVEDLCREFGVAPSPHPALFPPAAQSGHGLYRIPAVAELAGVAAGGIDVRARSLAAREWFSTLETGVDDASLFLFHASRLARQCAAAGRDLYLLSEQGVVNEVASRPRAPATGRQLS
ncbi:MAG TPA: hypothetical protein VGG39_23725 [Polyangiaceae bacterium]|jgi:hypothetical protein